MSLLQHFWKGEAGRPSPKGLPRPALLASAPLKKKPKPQKHPTPWAHEAGCASPLPHKRLPLPPSYPLSLGFSVLPLWALQPQPACFPRCPGRCFRICQACLLSTRPRMLTRCTLADSGWAPFPHPWLPLPCDSALAYGVEATSPTSLPLA